MRTAAIMLFLAMLVTAVFAFTGPWEAYPVYTDPVTVAPYEFAGFLFWMFLLLFLIAVVVDAATGRPTRPTPVREPEVGESSAESTVAGGFLLALFFVVLAAITGAFGFEIVASAFAGLAMILFWLSVILALAAFLMGIAERRRGPHA